MPDIPTLYAASPLTSKVYEKLWLRELVVSAPQIGGEAEARITLQLFRSDADGVEAAPGEPIRITVSDLLATADEDADLAAAVSAIMQYVAKVGIEQGVVQAPEA
jgi:hypothetical protein